MAYWNLLKKNKLKSLIYKDYTIPLLFLQTIEGKNDVNPDLKEEAIITLEILKRLQKPSPPTIIGTRVEYLMNKLMIVADIRD